MRVLLVVGKHTPPQRRGHSIGQLPVRCGFVTGGDQGYHAADRPRRARQTVRIRHVPVPHAVLPLPAPVPGGEREHGHSGRRLRRRARPPAAHPGLQAPGQGSHPSRVEQRRAEAVARTAERERRGKAIQQKLDRLDEAFLYSESIDLATCSGACWRRRSSARLAFTICGIVRSRPCSFNKANRWCM